MEELSVVVCSREMEAYQKLASNITSKIDLPFQLLRIDNKEGKYSIAEAYNLGLERSNTDFIIFVHEDIIIHTQNFGHILIEYFKDAKIGIIGVAGSKVKTKIPTSWWENSRDSLVMNLIQHLPNLIKKRMTSGFNGNHLEEVVVVDGVFIALRKVQGIKFREDISGFHNYDQSISLEYRSRGFKNYVTQDVLIEHFSTGKKDGSLLKSNILLNKLYKKNLPQAVDGFSLTRKQKEDAYYEFLTNLRRFDEREKTIKYFVSFILKFPLSNKILPLMKNILPWAIKGSLR